MIEPDTPLDAIAEVDALDIHSVLSAETMKSLVATLKPHLEPGKRKLVYIFPASDAIGHVIGEMHALWTLHGEDYDELLVVISDRRHIAMPDGPARVAEQYVTFVETTDRNVMLLGHFRAPPQDFGLFELKLVNANGLCAEFYPSYLAKGIDKHFEIPSDMVTQGEAYLRDLGWQPGDRIIPLHMRETSYLPGRRYHSFRTVTPENYRPAINHLLDGGAWVFRMGDSQSTPMEFHDGRFIDLPHAEGYSDWMDIFLASRCVWSFNCSSGPAGYCHSLGVPSLIINNLPQPFSLIVPTPRHLYAFKHFKDRQENRHLSYAEILARGLTDFSESREFDDAGIEVVENSPEEILDAVKEMEARVAGKYVEDESIQPRFRALGYHHDQDRGDRVSKGTAPPAMIEAPHYCFSAPWVTISEAFCRRHPGFLGDT